MSGATGVLKNRIKSFMGGADLRRIYEKWCVDDFMSEPVDLVLNDVGPRNVKEM